MATSLIGGLIKAGIVSPAKIAVYVPSFEKAQALASEFGITAATSNDELVEISDIIVLAVKPQVLQKVLQPLSRLFSDDDKMLISVVAGISANSIQSWLANDLPIVRVMPNTPALVGSGASGMFANDKVSTEQRKAAMQLMQAVGVAEWVTNEKDIDSVTALSGSGPAYFMLFIQSLVNAGVAAGLEPETAKKLALATASGTAELVSTSNLSLQTLIDNVTSPNGTTEQALKMFHQHDLPAIVQHAFDAAKRRSEELAQELG